MLENVVIVTEDVDLRNFLYDVFSSMGYSVTATPSGHEAINLFSHQVPSLMLIDRDMSHMPWIELIKKSRELDKDVKIVVLCLGQLSEDEVNKMAHFDVSCVVKKDFSNLDMLKEVFNLLKQPKEQRPVKEHKGDILIVDDETDTREVLINYLEKRGYKAVGASNGEEALYKINVKRPRLVLLDIRMHGMDGIMVLKRIKDIDSAIKVVMVSAVDEEYIAKEARDIGANNYILKPVNLKELESLVEKTLENSYA